MEWIQAIGGLWPLALIIFASGFTISFRNQIGERLRTSSFRFRRGNTEIEIIEPEGEAVVVDAEESSTAEGISPLEPSVDGEPRSASDLFSELFAAIYVDGDLDRGEAIFERLQEVVTEPTEITRNKAAYLYLRYERGDTKALLQLQELAKEPEAEEIATWQLGRCYKHAGQFRQAIEAFETSLLLTSTPAARARRTIDVARCLRSDGQPKEAFAKVMKEIVQESSSEAATTLYSGLASLYEDDHDWEHRAFALEKALENDPGNVELLFRAAYSYSQGQFNTMALLHYDTLLGFSPDHAAGLNNVGVAYLRLEMPIQSVSHYQQAHALGNTLATSNLANNLLAAGFRKEASELVDVAKTQSTVHENVGNSISRIASSWRAESEEKTRIISEAREQQRFFSSYGRALFATLPDTPGLAGRWETTDGTIIEIQVKDGELLADWSNPTEYRLTGAVSNQAAKLDCARKQAVTELYVHDSTWYTYVSGEANRLEVLKFTDKKITMFHLVSR